MTMFNLCTTLAPAICHETTEPDVVFSDGDFKPVPEPSEQSYEASWCLTEHYILSRADGRYAGRFVGGDFSYQAVFGRRCYLNWSDGVLRQIVLNLTDDSILELMQRLTLYV